MKRIKVILFILFVCITINPLYSQFDSNEGWSVTVHGGFTAFYGDLTEKEYSFLNTGTFPEGVSYVQGNGYNSPFSSANLKNRNIGGGLKVDKYFNPFFGLGVGFITGSLTDERVLLNRDFHTTFWEATLFAYFDLSSFFFENKNERPFSAYIFSGIGVLNYISYSYDMETGIAVSHSGSKAQGMSTDGIVPIGFGLDFRISQTLFIKFESSIRGTNSDVLDAHISPITNIEGYGYSFLGLSYKFQSNNLKTTPWGVKYRSKSSEKSLRQYHKERRKSSRNKTNKRSSNRWLKRHRR